MGEQKSAEAVVVARNRSDEGLNLSAFFKVVVASTVFLCGVLQLRLLPFRVERDRADRCPVSCTA